MEHQDAPSVLEWIKHNDTAKDDKKVNKPDARSGHTLTILGTNGYMFGGIVESPEGDAFPVNDMFQLSIGSNTMEWERYKVAGKNPISRWRHTTNLFDNTQLLVIGGFHAHHHRLNDVWVFDPIAGEWYEPNPEHNKESVANNQLAISPWANVPSPRGAHSTCIVEDVVYVFGGYGGSGYSRRELDDLYSLDYHSWTWTKIGAKGAGPEKRSGHQACAVEKKMYVFGGWNCSTQFNDLYALDVEHSPPIWSKLQNSLTAPTWNHTACSVMAIPSWKIFTFGGTVGPLTDRDRQGQMSDSIAILETGNCRWTYPDVEGKGPTPRADTAMAYDLKNSKLLVFGGWSEEWHCDLYTLDVGDVVGPPYAITDMLPSMGPITGGTDIVLHGIDFVNTADVVVRFGTKRNYIDVAGVFVNQSMIKCISPDFTRFPAGEVNVRLALNGDAFTTTFQKYSFFSVTNAFKSIMFGPGLLSGCAVNEDVSFIIQARDDNGNNRTTGGDQFMINIVFLEGGPEGEDVPITNVHIKDNQAGQYVVTYIAPHAGRYEIKVQFMGTFGGQSGQVKGSDVIITFDEDAPRDNNLMAGELVMRKLQGDIMSLQKLTKELTAGIFVRVKEDSWSSEEHIRVLVKVKENLIRMEDETAETNLLVVRCEAIIDFLNEQAVDLNRLDEHLGTGKLAWEKILREAPQVQAKISPMMRSHSSKIRNDIASYEKHVQGYKERTTEADFYKFATGPRRSKELINEADEVHKQEESVCQAMNHIADIFECSREMQTSREIVNEVADLLRDFRVLWECNENVVETIDSAKQTTWKDLNSDEFEDSARGLVQSIRRLPKSVRASDAFKGLDRIAKEFLSTCPLITSLRSPAMRERHWRELMEVVKREFPLPAENPDMLLKDLLELELHKVSADVEEITDKALKEGRHEETLKNLEIVWSSIQFSMSWYKDTDVPLLKLQDESVDQLESDQMAVQSIVSSRYAFFKQEAATWQQALSDISEIVQLLSDIQRTWSYLEPLFVGSEEVKRELPEDARRFQGIDEQVKTILQRAWKMKNVKAVCTQSGLAKKLEDLEKKQDQCKKSLSEFLDGKRRQFPRFYFMSESDLLDLLSNSSQPAKVLQHVDKIMLATKELTLESVGDSKDGSLQVSSFISGVGKETLFFDPPVRLIGKAEMYLLSLLKNQRSCLSKCLTISMERYPTQKRVDWLLKKDSKQYSVDPAQINLLVAQIDFCTQIELQMVKIAEGVTNAIDQYKETVILQLSDLITMTQTSQTAGDRQRIMCMITLDAHSRDIIDILQHEKAYAPSDFQWQSKLRPSFLKDGVKQSEVSGAKFNICDAQFFYGFEYLGNGPRLVVTPLTDRIYVTATQALHLKMGCAPAGPAGTGKTETTKDLASGLGRCCYVFNCSPEMDYQSMGNIFKGLAASGSWGCFDEFNRLIPEVLSVCSVQFKAVCDNLKSFHPSKPESHKVTIEGDTVNLDPTCGVFITMNPGYLGRSELPEGLKALFRPITVIVPDLVLICENMLMAEGFLTAKVLASKFYGLYTLLSELLSKQAHYDWGLRAVKSVLVVAGMLKRAEPDLQENALLMRALRDFNIPKIVQADEIVFFGLLNDLFPDLNPPRVIDEDLSDNINIACEENGLWPDAFFSLKVLQLDELLDIRHCVFITGPPGAGKSSCWKMLQAARNTQKPTEKVKTIDLNPKTMPTEDLYGHISMATREWKDGLLSSLLRDLGRIPDEKPKWMILDGDLDANWIESMNSVMDDNKMLTLASNERIPLKSHMRMIFEIRDLKYATPATVSRAGILYMSTDGGSQWRSIIGSWVRSRPDEIFEDSDREKAHTMFEKYLPECLKYYATSLEGIVTTNDISLCISVLRLLDTVLNRKLVTDDNAFETTFVFCLIWGLGSVLTISDDGTDNRRIFSDWFRGRFKTVKIPSRETVFDYWLDPKTCKFESWKNSPAFRTVEFDSYEMNMTDVTVPTAETASVSYWLDALVRKGTNVMLAGPAGTGKTQLVSGMLAGLSASSHMLVTVNMNFYTSSSVLLSSIEAPLQKRTGSTFGPPGALQLLYFVDDLNLPEVDAYGTQSSIALIRQHIDYGHWYDIHKLSMKTVENCQYVTAMNPTAGSFSVNPRLQRHFTTIAIGMPTATSLLTIYETFLNGHLESGGFSPAVTAVSSNMIKGALAVHKEVAETFRKTVANFHYEFNIRHLANVFQGLLVATPQVFGDAEKFVFLWLHESERVYGDRLVDAEDLAKFKQIMQNQARKTFNQFNVTRFYMTGGVDADSLVFCHFADGTTQGDDLVYDRSSEPAALKKTLETALDEYNETNAVMNLVLFTDAVWHVARIVRIVKQTAGHALLVGVGGSGKQSLSRLAAHICLYSVVQITVNQHYGMNDFKTDLVSMFNKAGVKGEGVLFLLTDTQINNEKFFIYINDLLSSGNIPDLYTRDEKESVINSVTNKAKSAGYSQEPAEVWKFFIKRIRQNLHMALCFSPMGGSLRTRARRFPALASCTVIDWFQPWPEQALYSVGKKILGDTDLGIPEVVLAIEHFMPAAFIAVNKMCKKFETTEGRYIYTTPKSYLEMLNLYLSLLERKRSEADKAMTRLENGVEKLMKAASDVVMLEGNLKIMLESAEEKREIADGIAQTVTKEKDMVEVENAKAVVEAAKVSEIQAEVAAKQADASADLALAEPALLRAMAALDSLDRRDLGNCKTMAKPPPGVEDVFSAVMVLLAGINPNIVVQKTGRVKDKDRTWDAAKKALLGNVNGFLDELKGFKVNIDEGTVPEVNWKEVRPFLQLEHFIVEVIEKRNSAAAGLCSWVINIVNYCDIVQQVEPKRVALRAANESLDEANAHLEKVQSIVAELQARLDKLTEEFNAAEASRLEAQHIAENGKMKLELANRLTVALGSEKVRWSESIEQLRDEREFLVGDCLLASSFISYIGPFTKDYREELMNETLRPMILKPLIGKPIPLTQDVDAVDIMCTEAEIAEYQTQGLPADKVSSENGAIVLNSLRFPLLVDPQLQAITWIKKREALLNKEQPLQLARLGQTDLIRRLLSAVNNGNSFVIENMGEHIDATLMPVIGRTSIKRAGKRFLVIGDNEVEVNPNFRLYLHTKLNNPHYPPEIQAETALVNFSVTQIGLEDQLLAAVVKHERPDLAAQRAALIMQQNLFTIRVKQLEDKILERLADAQGDITEDRALIEELELSKKLSDEIALKLEDSVITSEKIETTSEMYRPVARRGSLIFFVMNSLHKIHTYYMFSLESFVRFFLRGVGLAGKDKSLEDAEDEESVVEVETGNDIDLNVLEAQIAQRVAEIELRDQQEAEGANLPARLELLKASVSRIIFDFVRSGLFERDKLTVATLITLRIMIENGSLEKVYVDVIMRGRVADEVPAMGEELSKWLAENSWARAKALEEDLGSHDSLFEGIMEKISGDAEEWEEWYNQSNPENHPMPGEFSKLKKDIRHLLMLRVFRPDRLPVALSDFIQENLGDDFVNQSPFSMAKLFRDTTPKSPVLFVLYPGVDPTSWVEDLGKEKGITAERGMFANISMGQGQEARADDTIRRLGKVGGWIFLQNVHLMQSWLPTLDEKLETLSPHKNFRVFISAEPPPLSYLKNIPESLLQSSICIANEPPSDLRANLARAWNNFDQNRIDQCVKPEVFKACLFGLSFFHSLMLGRRRFGFQGWSRAYGFNVGDLRICADVLESYLNRDEPKVPYQDLRYIFGEIMYGGHITDFFDRRTNNTYLTVVLNDKLLNRGELAPKLLSPDCRLWDYHNYSNFISKSLPPESPVVYGLHPNAEIGFLTNKAEDLFQTTLRLEVGSTLNDGGGNSVASVLKDTLDDIMHRCPQSFDLIDLADRFKEKVSESVLPYAVVVIQECTRLNALLHFISTTLEELKKGMNGQLNMSQGMEDLAECLTLNQVPGRNPFHACSWEKLAWASRKSLSSWFTDMLARKQQLDAWTSSPNLSLPFTIWLPGLINPTALLTAIMQVTARAKKLPLDHMTLDTHVTRMYRPDDAIALASHPEDGIFIHGLFMEGARWTDEEESADHAAVVGTTPCAGHITTSKLKQLLTQMPIFYVKAVPVQPQWLPESVGYLRREAGLYECPVYLTSARGGTFVFLSTLTTVDPVHKWILAGVALLMQSDE